MSNGDYVLPTSWVTSTLGEAATVVKEKVDPSSVPDAHYVGLEHVEAHTMRLLGRGHGSDVKSAKTKFAAGDVLYGKLRPYLNKVAIPEFDGICSTDFLVFTESDHLESRYLAHFLNQLSIANQAHHLSAGVELPRVDWKGLSSLPISYPASKDEQHTIVQEIEKARSSAESALAHLATVRRGLERFRQAVLSSACAGRLTADWREANLTVPRGDARLPSGWRRATVAELCERVSVGHVGPTSKYYTTPEEGVPFVRSQNVRPGRLVMENTQFITKPFHETLRKSQLRSGDVLIVRVGANRGDCCMVPREYEGPLNCANIVFARPRDVDGQYLALFFQGPGRSLLLKETTGSAQGVINTKAVAATAVDVPPIEEQRLIVERASQMLAWADTVLYQVANSIRHIDRSSQAVLAKAFRGELAVANDEE
jgi:type I restriction enzyme, S subunit